jgi:hypothetical protein
LCLAAAESPVLAGFPGAAMTWTGEVDCTGGVLEAGEQATSVATVMVRAELNAIG